MTSVDGDNNQPQNLSAEAEATFQALSTGTIQIPVNDPVWTLVNHYPTLVHQVREATTGMSSAMHHWAAKNPPANAAFDLAGIFLNAATDAMLSIYNQVAVSKTLTTFTTHALIRQMAECALSARWLLEDPSPNGLKVRGFAAAWSDLKERQAFVANGVEAGAFEPPHGGRFTSDVALDLSDLKSVGERLRLMNATKKAPLVKMPIGRELFINVEGPEPYTDMRWLYNFLSGITHGKAWATLMATKHDVIQEYLSYTPDGMPQRSEVVLTKTSPRLDAMRLPLQVATLQVASAAARLIKAQNQEPPSF